MRHHLSNLAKYICVGGTAAVADLGIFYLFAVVLEFNYLVVAAAGFLLAAGINYLLCVRFIYSSGARFSVQGEVAAIYLISAMGLGVHQLVLFAAYESLALPLMVSKILATGLVFFWNFSLRNFYLFAVPRLNEN